MSDPDAAIEDALSEEAEEVRAYLVMLRGGAPFLSGADGRLLVEWLDAGVPATTILLALEAAAARRMKRPTRSRLSLSASKGELKRLLARSGARLPSPSAAPEAEPEDNSPRPHDPAAPSRAWPALLGLAAEVGAMDVAPALRQARAALVGALQRLGEGRDPSGAALPADGTGERVARAAIAACRAFHEIAWNEAEDERAALLEAARRDLASLAEVLPEEAFQAAAEEVARDRLRARTPLVSASVVWDRLIAGG